MTMSLPEVRKHLPRPAGTTVKSCAAFLRRLAQSPAAYHLDSDPEEITDPSGVRIFSGPAARWLAAQVGRCFAKLGDERAWGVYGEAYETR